MASSHPQCYWITGLPSAGKTTLAISLKAQLQRIGNHATILDGDALRKGLCADLGLSEQDRHEYIRRASQVAKLFFDAGISPICAFISPYAVDRDNARALFPSGHFIEIYLATPLSVCMARDAKGLYAKAQQGLVTGLTGLDAPYEPPLRPEFQFDTQCADSDAMVKAILANH
jgi:adenylyl-sulfate kinase